MKHLPIGQTTPKKLRDATDAYITMQALKENTEWLAGKQGRCERINILAYFAMTDEQAVHDGLLFKWEPGQECSQT